MTRFYLMANKFQRFHSELALCHQPTVVCTACRYPVRRDEIGLEFFWDATYGMAERAINAGHTVFWGELSMAATHETAEILGSQFSQVVTSMAKCISAREIRNRHDLNASDFELPLLWISSKCCVDLVATDVRLCDECGKVADSAWKLTGLKVHRGCVQKFGVFMINQNRGQPLFATEEAKMRIEATDIRGIKFYSAGNLVD